MTTFTIPGKPVAKGRPRVASIGGHARAYTPAKTAAAEQSFLALALPYRPAEPLDGPIAVRIVLALPVPASWSKRKRTAAAEGDLLPAGRPDLDNYAKLILDALNGVFWRDDAQIVDLRVTKAYALGAAGTTVAIEEYGVAR